MLDLLLTEIQDEYSRENFRRIQIEHAANPLTKSRFRVVEVILTGALTNFKALHGLNFVPKDIILTRLTGAGQLTVNYDKTDSTSLDLTSTAACVARLLCGSFS